MSSTAAIQEADQPEVKTAVIDVTKVSDFLSRKYREVTANMPRGFVDHNGPNEKYKLDVEFCYRLDEIQRGPVYMFTKLVQQMNSWIASIQKAQREAK